MRRDPHFRPLAFGLAASLTMALCMVAGPAVAQTAQTSTPTVMQGFSKNRDQPVAISAASLEVRDKDKVATFTGSVHVIQGEMHLRCQTLVVHYEGDTASGGAKPTQAKSSVVAAQPGADGQSRIKKLEAKGGVTVTQNDQIASGDNGVFEMKENTVTLTGKVVLTQGKNVSRGDKLVVDMTTGRAVMTASPKAQGGRVHVLIDPNAAKDMKKDGAAAPGARPPAPAPAR